MSSTMEYVLRLKDMILQIAMKDALYQFSTILAIATKLLSSTKYCWIGNGHENFDRRSFLSRSLALLLSPFIGLINRSIPFVMADSYLGGAR